MSPCDPSLLKNAQAYRHLPHADIVCLNTSPAMARNVLADYVDEMDNRWARFRRINVFDLAEYRANTGEKLLRMLMIIDEFQRLFDAEPDELRFVLVDDLKEGVAFEEHNVSQGR